MQLLRQKGISSTIMIGDSLHVISQSCKLQQDSQSNPMHLTSHISCLQNWIISLSYFHVLRALNLGVDAQANRGAFLPFGKLQGASGITGQVIPP